MSTSRSIKFLSESKSPMIEFIQQSMREIYQEEYGNILSPMFHDNFEGYSSMFVLPNGESLEYFGGEEVFEEKFDEINSKFKLWAYMGGSNTTYKDKVTGNEFFYPIPYFRLLMDRINKSSLENDVYLITTTDSGGWVHKTKQPLIHKLWTGKFL